MGDGGLYLLLQDFEKLSHHTLCEKGHGLPLNSCRWKRWACPFCCFSFIEGQISNYLKAVNLLIKKNVTLWPKFQPQTPDSVVSLKGLDILVSTTILHRQEVMS